MRFTVSATAYAFAAFAALAAGQVNPLIPVTGNTALASALASAATSFAASVSSNSAYLVHTSSLAGDASALGNFLAAHSVQPTDPAALSVMQSYVNNVPYAAATYLTSLWAEKLALASSIVNNLPSVPVAATVMTVVVAPSTTISPTPPTYATPVVSTVIIGYPPSHAAYPDRTTSTVAVNPLPTTMTIPWLGPLSSVTLEWDPLEGTTITVNNAAAQVTGGVKAGLAAGALGAVLGLL